MLRGGQLAASSQGQLQAGSGAAAAARRSGDVREEEPHRGSVPGWAGRGAEQPPPSPVMSLMAGSSVGGLALLSQASSEAGTAAAGTNTGAAALDVSIVTEALDASIGTEGSDFTTVTEASLGSLSAAAADPSLPPLHCRWGHRPGVPQHSNPPRSAGPAAPNPCAGPAAPNPYAGPPPARQLISLGLLQIALGCSILLLGFEVLSLSTVPQVNNTCLFWAGSSVILSGILGLTVRKRPMIALANLFVLINIVCVLLNLAVFIMGCQGIQFASGLPRCNLVGMGENKICFCCEEFNLAKCTEKTVLKLYHVKSCNASHLLLKRVLLALCAMSALTTAICLVVAVLHCLQIFAARRSCINESLLEGQGHTLDPDDSASPVLPPSYSVAVHSSTPQASGRTLGLNMVPLSHISGARIKGIEVFCFLDPPPPYEAGRSSEQEGGQQVSGAEIADLGEVSDREASQGEEIPEPSSRESLSPSNASLVAAEVASRRAFNPLRKRSKSDPVLHCRLHQAAVLDYEAAMQSEVKPQLWPVTLQKRLRVRALRVVTPAQQAMSLSGHVLPFSCHSGLLHLEGCGDLSTFTTGED